MRASRKRLPQARRSPRLGPQWPRWVPLILCQTGDQGTAEGSDPEWQDAQHVWWRFAC